VEFARTISRETLRPLLVAIFVIVVPLIHLGGPLLLARVGPRWGWSGGYPTSLNLLGLLPVIIGASLLGWILITMLGVTRTLPPRVHLGFRPARLVQTGPYAWMRHPIYVAESCLWVGMIVLLGSPVAAAVFMGLALAGSNWGITREELALEEQFGEEYRVYRARVPALPHFRRAR
jgi:protein-S-isoprenylcysteine O-methyltransferase Ste14